MSKMEISAALARIQSAPPSSPMLVLSEGYDHYVQCSFANTLQARRIVASKQANVIGVFDSTADLDEVARLIKARVKSDRAVN